MSTIGETRERRGHGSVAWRPRRNQYEIRVRDPRRRERISEYMPGPESPAAEKAAHDRRIALVAEIRGGARRVNQRLTTGTWLDTWLELKAGRAASTRLAYASRISTYLKPELGRIPLAQLDETDIARAMKRLSQRGGARTDLLSTGTVDAAYRTLSAALNDAVKAGKITANPARLVTVARHHGEIVPPTIAQVDAILEALAEQHPREHALLTLARWTGAREGELFGLRWAELDIAGGMVTIRRQVSGRLKTSSSRRVLFLAQPVLDVLREHPRGLSGALVFRTSTGGPLDGRNVLRRFQAAADSVGAHPPPESDRSVFRVHDLRHAFATMALEAGASSSFVSHWLGHASLAQLDRYGHVIPAPGGESYRRLMEAFGPRAVDYFGLARREMALGSVLTR